MFFIFVLLPSFLVILEKDIVDIKKEQIKVKTQKALHSTNVKLQVNQASKKKVSLIEFRGTFEHYLKENFGLKNDLTPINNSSIAQERVEIKYLNEYQKNRKYLRVELAIPIKPNFYKKLILQDKKYLEINVSFKTSFPVDS